MIEQITLDEVLKLVTFENFDGSVGGNGRGRVGRTVPALANPNHRLLLGQCGRKLQAGVSGPGAGRIVSGTF